MAELLDASWFGACAYGIASAAMVMAWYHEWVRLDRIGPAGRRILWPTCWLLIGAVYASLALALGLELAGTLGGLGREYARSEEWYESRRPLQAAVVAIVGVTWLTIIVVGIWRVPERRRRYLASALLCTSLVCFAIIRLVSFHYVDTILVRTSLAEVPLGTIVELIGIVLAVVVVAMSVRRPVPDSATESGVSPTSLAPLKA